MSKCRSFIYVPCFEIWYQFLSENYFKVNLTPIFDRSAVFIRLALGTLRLIIRLT